MPLMKRKKVDFMWWVNLRIGYFAGSFVSLATRTAPLVRPYMYVRLLAHDARRSAPVCFVRTYNDEVWEISTRLL